MTATPHDPVCGDIASLATVEPPCPHAAACGGCAHQDRGREALAAWKRQRVVSALAARGLSTVVHPTLSVPEKSRRRAKFAAVRTKKAVRLGFLKARSHEVVDIAHCLVLRPSLLAALPKLRELAGMAAPRARRIAVWAVETETGLDVALEEAKPLDLSLRERAAEWADAADVARLSWNGEPVAARRAPIHRIGKAVVVPPPGAFLQAAGEAEAWLVDRALRWTEGAERVSDLFCGCGTFALRLAERAEVLAAEGDVGLIGALQKAWRRAEGLKQIATHQRDLFRRPFSPAELHSVEAVVFDPPRQGAEAQARQLAQWKGAVIVGASCEPETFARDAAILAEGGWRLLEAQPIDQFLWSGHVELIGRFVRS